MTSKRRARFTAHQINLTANKIIKVDGQHGIDMTEVVRKLLRDYSKLVALNEEKALQEL